jgi:hypothetical protein
MIVGYLFTSCFGKPVSGGFGGRRFEVKQRAGPFLIFHKPLPHVVQYVFRKLLGGLMHQISSEPIRVQAGLVHPDKADGREMIVKGAEILFMYLGVVPCVHEFRDHGGLGSSERADIRILSCLVVEIRLVA